MIITDFSQIYLAAMHNDPNMAALAKQPTDENRNFIIHMTLNSIRSHVVKYMAKYGKLVIATDGRNTWRRDVFEHYKVTRKHAKKESDLDWDFIYSVGNEIRDIIKTYLPYPIINVDKAEADDIIATLVKYTQENPSKAEGALFDDEPENVLILSSDGDFKQLHKYKNVSQFSTIQKKMVTCQNPRAELLEKIIKGDISDSIPNIKTHDNFFYEKCMNPEKKMRQNVISAKYVERLLKNPLDFDSDTDRENYKRNEILISFDSIPLDIEESIIKEYHSQSDKNPSKMAFYQFLSDRSLNQLRENIQDFYL